MKKNKTLVVALAIVLTLSIGYALFSQTINITGTATAQGSFSFTPVCTIGIDDGLAATTSAKATETSSIITKFNTIMTSAGLDTIPTTVAGSSNNTCTISGNTVTISTTLSYPGAMSLFTIKITNTGTISGIFDDDADILSGGSSSGVNGANIAIYIDGVNSIPSNISDIDTYQSSVMTHVFAPNDVLYLIYVFYWDPDSSTSCTGTSCQYIKSYDIPFVQAN